MSRPSPGAPPQRVCPHCATLAYSAEPRCPFCGRSYKRRILPAVAAMLLLTAAVVLGGVALMLVAAGDEFDRRVDRQVESVQDEFGTDVDRLERRIRRELDERLPATPTPTPSP
jgi:hypothetical protein